MRLLLCLVGLLSIAVATPACRADVRFVDVATESGVDFKHNNGAQGERFLPETYGSGGAFLDYDGDGWLDLYLVNGGRIPGLSDVPLARNELYHNGGDGSFVRRADAAGVGDVGYGMGATVGDYDNDGDPDLYVTNFGPNVLYQNRGDGTFVDVSIGVDDGGWGTSAAFVDVDLDGDLDLYVGNYVEYPITDPLICRVGNSGERLYCDPRKFEGQSDRLYINGGSESGWGFVDRTRAMGLHGVQGKQLGVIFGDYDLDGDPDLYLANDMTPNMLYRNDGGHFVEKGLASGTSLNDEGGIEAGMGVDMADADGDGRADLFVTNFQWESNTLYHNLGHGFFTDATVASGINKTSMTYLGFGTRFFDYDNDGDLDLFVANGHVYDNVKKVDHASSYAQRNQLLENIGDGRYVENEDAGPGFDLQQVSRGAAFADYDNDGDVDIAVNNSGQQATLLRNDGGNAANWLGLVLRGVQSNRDALGARIKISVQGRTLVRELRSGGSYLSAHDPRMLVGLGAAEQVERIEVQWLGGAKQVVESVAGNQYLLIEEKVVP